MNIPAHESIRTSIEGTIVDGTGNPISGVVAVYENGQSATSDSLGFIRISAYGSMFVAGTVGDNNNDRTGFLGFSSLSCGVSVPRRNVNITQFEASQQYSTSVSFVVNPNLVGTFVSGSQPAYLARNATYELGFVFQSRNGQKTLPSNLIELRMPDVTENFQDGAPIVDIEIFSQVPIPKVGERFIRAIPVLTRNLTYFDHIEWVASDIRYVNFIDVNAVAPENKYQLGSYGTQATQIVIVADFDLYNGVEFNAYGEDRARYYEFTPGDTIKFIYDENGFIFPVNLSVEIRGLEDSRYLIIENTSGLPELKAGMRFRISKFRNQVGEQKLTLFERGNCIEIVDPYGANPTFAQTTFRLNAWDTHYLTRVIPTREFYDPNNPPSPLPPIVYRINTYASPGPSDFNIASLEMKESLRYSPRMQNKFNMIRGFDYQRHTSQIPM